MADRVAATRWFAPESGLLKKIPRIGRREKGRREEEKQVPALLAAGKLRQTGLTPVRKGRDRVPFGCAQGKQDDNAP